MHHIVVHQILNCLSLLSTVARLQFRLPDGRAQTRHFDPEDALAAVYDFVGEMNVGFRDFSLSTTYPSKQLDREDR